MFRNRIYIKLIISSNNEVEIMNEIVETDKGVIGTKKTNTERGKKIRSSAIFSTNDVQAFRKSRARLSTQGTEIVSELGLVMKFIIRDTEWIATIGS